MDAFIKLDKMNKKRNSFSTSNVSRKSFGSILQSIRETENAEEDETNSQYSTPKNKAPKNQFKLLTGQIRNNLSSVMSSDLNTTSINLTTEIGSNQQNVFLSIDKNAKHQRPQMSQKKPVQVEQKSSAAMILKKLGKGFETENSSRNTQVNQFEVLKTSYIDKSKILKEPPRKWGTDMKKSFATSLSSDYDSELDFLEDENLEHEKYFVEASNRISLEEPYFATEQNKNQKNTQNGQNHQIFFSSANTSRSEENRLNKSFGKNPNYKRNQLVDSFQVETKRFSPKREKQKINIQKPPQFENYIDTSSQNEDVESLSRKFRYQKAGNSSVRSDYSNFSKTQNRGRHFMPKNTCTMTGKKGETVREYTVAILEYCSHEIGLACYNNTTGEFHLCQLVENLTYFRTLSTVEIFAPLEIIYSITFENTLLIKRLKEYFRQTSFKGVFRRFFDEQSGYNLYLKTSNREYLSSTSRFLAFSCFNALLLHLETNVEKVFKHQSLSVKWHKLDQLLVIEPDAVSDLQIFYNYETKKNKKCLVENFHCITFGGTRMLRANLLQPPSEQKIILERQKLLEKLLENPSLLEFICKEFHVYKLYEPVTAKFVQSPKQQNFKSLKTYLSSILLLSKQCLSLGRLYTVLQERNAFQLPIFQKLDSKLQHHKVKMLKNLIEETFDEYILKNFESMKNKKDKYIFLFKVEKIQDPFAAVTREVYNQTVDTIKQYFEVIKRKTNEEMQLMFNDHKGYFVKVQDTIDLHRISQKIEENLVQISGKGKNLTFSTQILSSLNNRLKQSEHVLVLQSESLLRKVIGQIQKNIDILFQINQIFSTIDMVMSFASYINRYSIFAKFHRPTFVKGINKLHIVNLKPVWLLTPENHDQNNLKSINLSIEGDQNRVVLLEKSSNSISQSSFMFSTAYAIILSQMGCFVPAEKFQLRLFDSILSKIQIDEKTEQRISRFQMNLIKIQNIFDNCFIKNEGRSLVLMDEIVRGSQHQEECALSLATVKQLEKNKGISILSTSDRKLIQFMLFWQEFENIKIVRTKHAEEEKKAIQEISVESIQIMENSNFDSKFIDFFDQINIQTTYTKIDERLEDESSGSQSDQKQNSLSSLNQQSQNFC